MKITGVMINYYIHCKRQCYLFSKKINLEDNSEDVRIGKILHEIKSMDDKDSEVKLENAFIDRISKDFVLEYKKSDADIEAARMQLLFYLKILKDKGIYKKGKLICNEKNTNQKIEIIELNENTEKELEQILNDIDKLINNNKVPETYKLKGCKRCAYYTYCYI